MIHSRKQILAIVVTYEPDWHLVFENVIKISESIDVFISDNSAEKLLLDDGKIDNIFYWHNGGNIGIAAAQNVAIKFAKTNEYEYVIFIDDDSTISFFKIKKLLADYEYLNGLGYKISALCAMPDQTGGLDLKKTIPGQNRFFFAENLMSSCSVTAVKTFADVGVFDADLFIDYVDYEWGWRARGMGYSIVIDSSVKFSHHLGEGVLDLKLFKLGIPSPIRHYFQTRNLLRMLTLSYVPIRWKISQCCLFPLRFIIFSFIYQESKKRRQFFLKGIRDFFK